MIDVDSRMDESYGERLAYDGARAEVRSGPDPGGGIGFHDAVP